MCRLFRTTRRSAKALLVSSGRKIQAFLLWRPVNVFLLWAFSAEFLSWYVYAVAWDVAHFSAAEFKNPLAYLDHLLPPVLISPFVPRWADLMLAALFALLIAGHFWARWQKSRDRESHRTHQESREAQKRRSLPLIHQWIASFANWAGIGLAVYGIVALTAPNPLMKSRTWLLALMRSSLPVRQTAEILAGIIAILSALLVLLIVAAAVSPLLVFVARRTATVGRVLTRTPRARVSTYKQKDYSLRLPAKPRWWPSMSMSSRRVSGIGLSGNGARTVVTPDRETSTPAATVAEMAIILLGAGMLMYFIFTLVAPWHADSLGFSYPVAGPGLGSGYCLPTDILSMSLDVPNSLAQDESGLVSLVTSIAPDAARRPCKLDVQLLAPTFDLMPVTAEFTVDSTQLPTPKNPGERYTYIRTWLIATKAMGTYRIVAVVNTCMVFKGISVVNTFGLMVWQTQLLSLLGTCITLPALFGWIGRRWPWKAEPKP